MNGKGKYGTYKKWNFTQSQRKENYKYEIKWMDGTGNYNTKCCNPGSERQNHVLVQILASRACVCVSMRECVHACVHV